MKPTDYLDSIAYQPGEFERLQAEHDVRVRWLSSQLEPALWRELAAQGDSLVHTAIAQYCPGAPLPSPVQVEGILREMAAESAVLLAQQALHAWFWLEREAPGLAPQARAAQACEEALQQEGLSTVPGLADVLSRSLLLQPTG